MFARTIIDSDEFLDLPPSAQLLYFHLGMRADDDGFVNKPRSVVRMVGCKMKDLETLLERNYLIRFDSGIVVIRHWKVHNHIRKDSYKETIYKDEKKQLGEDKNRVYYLVDALQDCDGSVTGTLQGCDGSVTGPLRQDRIGKDRSGEDRLGKVSQDQVSTGEGRAASGGHGPVEGVWCVPPSVTEVLIYCKQKKFNVDPDVFVAFYKNRLRPQDSVLRDWKEVLAQWA